MGVDEEKGKVLGGKRIKINLSLFVPFFSV
jgi:hypothetical protein